MAAAELPDQMKAQVLEGYGTAYTFTTCPLPKIASKYEIVVKVEAAGYCHTDAVLAAGDRKGDPASFPHIGGHEFVGNIVAFPETPSEAVNEYRIGSRVGIPGRGFGACGSCNECTGSNRDGPGYSVFCPKTQGNGLSKHGGFAEYAVVDIRQCVPVPSSMSSLDAAPLMCAGVTIFNAIKCCNLSAGQHLGIIGCGGGLGHLGLQFADALGLDVTGVDAADGPLELAKSLGTKARIVDARSTSADAVFQEDMSEGTKLQGLDALIVLPESQASFDYGMKMLRNHGLCVVVSIPTHGFRVSAVDLVFRGIKVQGTILGTNRVLRETVAFAAEHNIKPVKKTFALNQLNQLVAEYHKGFGGKLVVDLSI